MTDVTETTIRVAIIEDRREIREGLAMIINGTAGFRCAGTDRSMEDALEHIGQDKPHVVLNDIGLPGMSGIEGIRILKERHPSLPILMLTVYEDDDRIFEALCAGASGYLLKKTPPARLLTSSKCTRNPRPWLKLCAAISSKAVSAAAQRHVPDTFQLNAIRPFLAFLAFRFFRNLRVFNSPNISTPPPPNPVK